MKKHLLKLFCALAITLTLFSPFASAFTPEERSLFRNSGIIFFDPYGCAYSSRCTSSDSIDERAAFIAGTLAAAGYELNAILGILGNLHYESTLDPKKLQLGRIVDDDFRAWDNGKTFGGSAPNGKKGEDGFGLAQWTTDSRVQALQEYADSNNLKVTCLEAQVGFMIEELQTWCNCGPSRLNPLSLEDATKVIFNEYESPGDSTLPIRTRLAQSYRSVDTSRSLNIDGGGGSDNCGVSIDCPNLDGSLAPGGTSEPPRVNARAHLWAPETWVVVEALSAAFAEYFFDFGTYIPEGGRPSCHPRWGIDATIPSSTMFDLEVRATTEAIVECVMENREALGVTTIVYYDKINSPRDGSIPYDQWRDYVPKKHPYCFYRQLTDSTCLNQRHINHVHFTAAPCKG